MKISNEVVSNPNSVFWSAAALGGRGRAVPLFYRYFIVLTANQGPEN